MGKYSVSDTKKSPCYRVIVYGGGGLGKSSLAAMAPNAVFINCERGLHHLPGVKQIEADEWPDVRGILADKALLTPYTTIVLDTGTKAEELCRAFICKANNVNSLDDIDWGGGQKQVFDQFQLLKGDLENWWRQGKNVVMVCHDDIIRTPNPQGEDFLRYEMRLQNSPKCNIRAAFKEWADIVAHVCFDIAVDGKDHKAKDTKSRAIFTEETPTRMAKSRGKIGTVEYLLNQPTFWRKVFEG